MTEVFKKGQLVPRRLRMAITADRKAQSCVVFGCDANVEGRRITAMSEGPIFMVRRVGRRMNNGTFKKSRLLVKDVYFNAATSAIERAHGIKEQ